MSAIAERAVFCPDYKRPAVELVGGIAARKFFGCESGALYACPDYPKPGSKIFSEDGALFPADPEIMELYLLYIG